MPCDIYDSMMIMWAQKDSNLRLAACKAATLNQLSYAPVF
jgi:hypothetical protein